MGQTESNPAGITPTLSPEIKKLGFPQRFIISYRRSWTGFPALLLSKPYSDPSFLISMAQGRFGDMVLHSGPTKDDPPLANAKPRKWHQHYTIALPSPNGGAREEVLQLKWTLLRDKFRFGMEVGDGTDRRMERFEWKTRGFGGWLGWKLVRVRNKNENPNKVIEEDPEKAVGNDPEKIVANDRDGEDEFMRDGEDIVAVWDDAKMNFYKLGEFEFRGAGATGQFGQVWALMAVMTFLCIWQKYEHEAFTTAMLAEDSHSHSDPRTYSDPQHHSHHHSDSHQHI